MDKDLHDLAKSVVALQKEAVKQTLSVYKTEVELLINSNSSDKKKLNLHWMRFARWLLTMKCYFYSKNFVVIITILTRWLLHNKYSFTEKCGTTTKNQNNA
jgi:hypothetical protein